MRRDLVAREEVGTGLRRTMEYVDRDGLHTNSYIHNYSYLDAAA